MTSISTEQQRHLISQAKAIALDWFLTVIEAARTLAPRDEWRYADSKLDGEDMIAAVRRHVVALIGINCPFETTSKMKGLAADAAECQWRYFVETASFKGCLIGDCIKSKYH